MLGPSPARPGGSGASDVGWYEIVHGTRSFFFTQRPGALLFTAFCVAQTISTLICVFLGYQLSPMIGLGMKCDLTQVDPVTGIPEVNLCTERNEAGFDCASTYCTSNLAGGWAYAGLVWAYCAIWFLIQDGAKLIAITLFDMSDPEKAARRRENGEAREDFRPQTGSSG